MHARHSDPPKAEENPAESNTLYGESRAFVAVAPQNDKTRSSGHAGATPSASLRTGFRPPACQWRPEGPPLLDPEVRVPGHLPQVSVRVREVAGIAAPILVPRRLDQSRAGRLCLLQDSVHLLPRPHVVRQREAWEPCPIRRHARVRGERLARKEREPGATGLEEGDDVDVALSQRQAEAIPVEAYGAGKVRHTEGDETDPGLQRPTPAPPAAGAAPPAAPPPPPASPPPWPPPPPAPSPPTTPSPASRPAASPPPPPPKAASKAAPALRLG